MIPTEPIGSLPRPLELVRAVEAYRRGETSREVLAAIEDAAVADTLRRMEATGSPVLTDGEQRKVHGFLDYPLFGSEGVAPGGLVLPFADGHCRESGVLTRGPFRYTNPASEHLRAARSMTARPLKQAIIAPSALSHVYPPEGVPGYPQVQFLDDLIDACEAEIRTCLALGAHTVQLDFTEARLAVKIDPSGRFLADLVEINLLVLDRFSAEERKRLGVHSCPGADRDSTHSADVDYASFLPLLFHLPVGNFFIQLASEPDPDAVLALAARHLRPEMRLFVGVIDPISPRIERPDEVRDRLLAASRHIPLEQLGSTDDCGFSPFHDDLSTSREVAFAKIAARVEGTALASRALGIG